MPNNTDPARALGYTPGRLDETAPERIWLQIDTAGNNADRDLPFPDADGVTWEQDSVGGLEIQYVRADLASAPPSAPAGGRPRKTVTIHKSKATGKIVGKHYAKTHPDAVKTLQVPAPLAPSERSALAQQPAATSAPEPEVHGYDPTERRETVTIRWPDGKCLGYVLDRTRYTDNLPPSAPVGVDLSNWAQHYSIGPAALEALRNLLSLAQQPAAPHWGNVPELDDEQSAAPSGEAVAWLRMTPDGTPEPLYAAPQQPAGVGGVPQAWISDNDLLKLHESVDEARNIRMSVRRTNTRVHPIYIPALAAQQQEPKS